MIRLTRYPCLIVGALTWATIARAQEAAPTQTPREADDSEPYIIEGGGVSIQPWFWGVSTRPSVRAGEQSLAEQPANFDFPRQTDGALGLNFSIPAGKQNSLRISYFRARGSEDAVAPTPLELFNVGYDAGDVLATTYKIQNVKLNWDYLSYTFPSRLRVKTLWGAQMTWVDTTINAPLKQPTIDEDDVPISYYGEGSKWVLYPNFGIGLEHAPSQRFRWEAKASGFAFPHRAATWDAEASAVLRFSRVEFLAGYKVFSVKTSPRDDFYFTQTLRGPYVGLKWYWYRGD